MLFLGIFPYFNFAFCVAYGFIAAFLPSCLSDKAKPGLVSLCIITLSDLLKTGSSRFIVLVPMYIFICIACIRFQLCVTRQITSLKKCHIRYKYLVCFLTFSFVFKMLFHLTLQQSNTVPFLFQMLEFSRSTKLPIKRKIIVKLIYFFKSARRIHYWA